MQSTTDFPIQSISRAVQVTAAQETAATRYAYIDVLRSVLTILVVMVHAAVTYGSIGDWTYVDPVQDELTSILLSFFLITAQSFFMGLFFFYAGFFTPASFDRKGPVRFWKDRLLRLGIPLIVYTYFLSRFPNYIDEVANHGMKLSFWQFTAQTFWVDADEGPTWFLFALLWFCLAYTVWRLAVRSNIFQVTRLPVPGIRTLLLTGAAMGLVMFGVSQWVPLDGAVEVFRVFTMRLSFFPQYILMFIAGILAYRSDWLARLPKKSLRFWAWMCLGLSIFLPVLFMLGGAPDGRLGEFLSGMNWRCLVFNLWIGFSSISFSMLLTLWLRDRVVNTSRLTAFAGANNYTVFLIHPLVLVPLAFGLSLLAIHPLVKFGIAALGTVVVCFLLADGLRRLPGAKAIL